jgi:hypothetical protein
LKSTKKPDSGVVREISVDFTIRYGQKQGKIHGYFQEPTSDYDIRGGLQKKYGFFLDIGMVGLLYSGHLQRAKQ